MPTSKITPINIQNSCSGIHFKALSYEGHKGYEDAQNDFQELETCKQCYAYETIHKLKRARKDYKIGYLKVAYHFHQMPHECGQH